MTNMLFKCEFGSAIYGTSTPESDQDFKGIYLPTARDILLQNVKRVFNHNTKTSTDARNTKDDVDYEIFSYQEYLKLLCEGQTPMLDMLFCPDKHVQVTSVEWNLIKENKKFFLHKGTSQFVGYTLRQAAKYGIKGSRVKAAELALDLLKGFADQNKTLNFYEHSEIMFSSLNNEYIKIVEILNTGTGNTEKHLEVCDRKIPFNSKVKNGTEIVQLIVNNFGHRARLAATNQGIDWKALYHSVRVGRQAEELLLHHTMTFPRPEAPLLMQIRKGELPYTQVAELIEDGLERMEAAKAKSTLPDGPDYNMAELMVMAAHKEVINRE